MVGTYRTKEEPAATEETEPLEQENPEVESNGEKVPAKEEEPSAGEEFLAEMEKAREAAKANQEQYLRTLAEMENLRKRTQREKEELAKFANENILREILPVIDNLERAVEHAEQSEMGETGVGLLEGVQMTLTQFSQVLDRFGVVPVDALGEPFDPAFHQAMGQLETDEVPVNCVAQQMQKGYQLHDRLLRPAMVMVAKAPENSQPEQAQDDPEQTDDN